MPTQLVHFTFPMVLLVDDSIISIEYDSLFLLVAFYFPPHNSNMRRSAIAKRTTLNDDWPY